MGLWDMMNEKVKTMTIADIGLTKFAVFFATIAIVKLFPQLLEVAYPLLIILTIACGAKPLYKMWFK